MKNIPLVSVIIPNYNHAPYLKQRIDSVLNQTFQDFELIILDDCSKDNSKEIIEQYRSHPRISSIIYNEANSGNTFKQWQKGIGLTNSKYVWIAESDDLAKRDFLVKCVEKLENNNGIGLVYSQSESIDIKGVVSGSWKAWTDDLNKDLFENDFISKGDTYITDFLIHRNTIPNASAVVFGKQQYNNVGGIDDDIKYCSDCLLWLKILSISDIAFISEPLNSFRTHSNSVIAKANGIISSYELEMRKRFKSFLEKQNKKSLIQISNVKLSSTYFYCGIENVNANNKLKGFSYILFSSLFPRIKPSSFLKNLYFIFSNII